MSEAPKTKSEIVISSVNQYPVRPHRWLIAVVCAVMAVMIVAGFVFLPDSDFLAPQRVNPAQAYQTELNPVLSAEVNTLKGQMVGLVSGSIESKLRSLEASVRSGTKNNSLETIQDLKNDLKVLRSYSESSPVNKPNVDWINQQLMQEMAQLKRLIYLTIASCAVVLMIFASVWLKNKRLPYKEAIQKLKARI